MAPRIIECEQGSELWYEARLGLPTASEFSTILAKGKDGVRAAVTGAGDNGVFRSKEIEAALAKNFAAAALDGVKVPAKNLMSDLHASADYRANLVAVMAKRAVAAANA